MKSKDLTGIKVGRLTVLRFDGYIYDSKPRKVYLCKCECGNEVRVKGESLTCKKPTRSCGCLRKETASRNFKKINKYDLSGCYGIGYTTNNNTIFIFDLDDYDKIKNHTWLEVHGYILSMPYNQKTIMLHRLIMDTDEDMIVDHINHDKSDNRKENLRNCTISQNGMNSKLRIDSKTGVTGVYKFKDRYCCEIHINGKKIHLGYYDDFDKAINVRKQAEEKYFGEYSYDNSMTFIN